MPYYLFYRGGVVLYYVCELFYAGNTALCLARLAFLNYANPVSAHASGAMQQ